MGVTVDHCECAQVPLDEDEEVEVALAKGQSVSIKYKASGELQPDGKRCAGLCRKPSSASGLDTNDTCARDHTWETLEHAVNVRGRNGSGLA